MSATTPRVSVIVPVKNRRDLLTLCLAGLAAQRYQDFEVIVVDDGSTDGAPDAVRDAAAAGLPARVVPNTGRGAVQARETGVGLARGELFAFTDSDCVPDPGWLLGLVEAFDAGAAFVQGPTLPERPPKLFERTMWHPGPDPRYSTCNIAYRRDAYVEVGGFEGALADRLGFRPRGSLAGLDFGIDTQLGWRVRRTGRRDAFAPDAVVRHAVFPFDRREMLRRSWMTGALPMLLREVPELRPMLRRGVLYGGIEKLAFYASIGAVVSGKPRVTLFTTTAWVALTVRRLLKLGSSPAETVRHLPDALAADALTATALACGSARARRLVL